MGRTRKKKPVTHIPTVRITVDDERLTNELVSTVTTKLSAFQDVTTFLKNNEIDKIICLGVGDPCCDSAARNQTAFIRNASKECQISNIMYFDPVICDSCKQKLTDLGITMIEEDTKGSFPSESKTFFYMPHCPRFLYHNLLATNWTLDKIKKLKLLSNSFYSYEERYLFGLQKPETFIEKISSFKAHNEKKLDFAGYECFDSLFLLTFDEAKISAIEAGLPGTPILLEEEPNTIK